MQAYFGLLPLFLYLHIVALSQGNDIDSAINSTLEHVEMVDLMKSHKA